MMLPTFEPNQVGYGLARYLDPVQDAKAAIAVAAPTAADAEWARVAKHISATRPAAPADHTRPDHYHRLFPEPAMVMSAWKLDANLAQVLKYMVRAGVKVPSNLSARDAEIRDLEKAAEFLAIRLEYVRRAREVETGRQPQAHLLGVR